MPTWKCKELSGKYLILPVSRSCPARPFRIRYGRDFMELDSAVAAPEEAEYTACYPLPDGHCTLEADEEVLRRAVCSDSPVQEGPAHQHFHLTARYGWLNDPNGLYYRDGEWHCFFQYNPFQTRWGNAHWARAVSCDLLHWRETGITLYPDRAGYPYSGGAVIDGENVSGLGRGAILLYYTAAHYGWIGSSQNVAYSLDGGKTFRKYAGNPLIEAKTRFIERDPAPVYAPDEKLWYMPLYLGDDDGKREFQLFRSTDLLHWLPCDVYRIANGWECPGLRYLRDEADGRRKWVFLEAGCRYRVAEIRQGHIRFLTEARQLIYGDAYAGQFYCNAPEDRAVFMAWIRMPECRFRTWNGSLSLPMEFSLQDDQLRVRPYAVPARQQETERPEIPFEAVFRTGSAAEAGFKFGAMEFRFRPGEGRLTAGKTEIPLPEGFTGGRLFADAATVEFFDDAGRFAFCFYLPDAADFSNWGWETASFYALPKERIENALVP